MARLILASNRLPLTLRAERGRLVVAESAGGLATGLKGTHDKGDSIWVGWPGDTSRFDEKQRAEADRVLAERRFAPVALSPAEVSRYYEGFSNSVLWPLFHYLLDRVPADSQNWEAYRAVNERFAEAIAAQVRPGDVVWVHDYQLMLVPAMLRRRLPKATIGFFLHIPFPAADLLRILPWREPLLKGMLGSDLVGFHTLTYRNHFAAAVRRVLGLANTGDTIHAAAREVRLGVFPMGVDTAHLQALSSAEDVNEEVAHSRQELGTERMLLGIDRLDYTKGMSHRLLAFERMLEREPQLRGRVRLVQVAVPSREGVRTYQQHRREVDERIGRINGAFGTAQWVPIHYVYRPLSEAQVVALYRAADVMLVTPLRDGMNLVAKEFVACRTDDDGVLVLSEFAGAAAEMVEAVVVNPYDVDAMAAAYRRALFMLPEERRFRMHALRRRVLANDVHYWVRSFVETLQGLAPMETGVDGVATDGALDVLTQELAASPRLVALLDYDGTLVPFAPAPDLAAPDDELLALLRDLSLAGVEVHLVSGRRRESLERWLGELPVALHAEHGFWSRARPEAVTGAAWFPRGELEVPWKMDLRTMLDHFTEMSPGSMVEEKTASLAWHYRMLDPELATTRVDEVRHAVIAHIRALPLEVIEGDKVIEVRVSGVNKGLVVGDIDQSQPTAIIAMGDDRTDEDLFKALPPSAASIIVGTLPSIARIRIEDHVAARRLLRQIIAYRSRQEVPPVSASHDGGKRDRQRSAGTGGGTQVDGQPLSRPLA
jgi:trehalose 6-phosphate synthase/phosphatase